jgi:hypothetical protein
MADQFKLKAFVRIDGSGKVIPGGPIFQAQKPKVGKWREINVKECCNYVPTSTTTTSSTNTTSTTTTSGIIDALLSVESCTGGTGMTIQFVTGSNLCDSPLVISGDFSFIPNDFPFYIRYNGIAKSFLRTSPTTATAIGGAPNECITCG